MITIEGPEQVVRRAHVLKDVNLSVRAGEFLVVLGPSGAGKSTMLRCVNGLVHADAGRDHDRRQGVNVSDAGSANAAGPSR